MPMSGWFGKGNERLNPLADAIARRIGPVAGVQSCTNCRAMLYRQWWSEEAGGFECRRCGTVNPGAAPGRGSTGVVIALSLVVVGLWFVGVMMAVAVLTLYPDGQWRAAAIAALVFLLGGFAVLIGTIVLAVRRRA
jgi:hypothetical protein